jgi:peptidoglycan/LPS O-acetylase OafA/YrhL
MQPDKRNHLIDLLRILAASWVVLFHLNQPIPAVDNWYRDFCKYGHLGVPTFFVISGYCILIALQHAKKPVEFIIRRFFRIFPPFWFSLLITAIIILSIKIIIGVNSSIAIPKTAVGILATVSLTTAPISSTTTINWVYWTLSCEVLFYIVVFLCAFFRRQYFSIALLVVTLLSIFLPPFENGLLFFLHLWPLFSIGLATYQVLHHPIQKWLSGLLLVLAVAAIYFTQQPPAYTLVCFVTVIAIVINHFKPLKSNFFSRLGDVSYSLYLIHIPIGIYLCGSLKIAAIQSNIVFNILYDVALLAGLIFLSGLMHRYVELPAIKYGKKFGR